MGPEENKNKVLDTNENLKETLDLKIIEYAQSTIEQRETIQDEVLSILWGMDQKEVIDIRDWITAKWKEASWKMKMRYYNLSAAIFNSTSLQVNNILAA